MVTHNGVRDGGKRASLEAGKCLRAKWPDE